MVGPNKVTEVQIRHIYWCLKKKEKKEDWSEILTYGPRIYFSLNYGFGLKMIYSCELGL